MDDPTAVILAGLIAAIGTVIVALITTQRVPARVRKVEKLAAAAQAIGAEPETRAELNRAIRAEIPPDATLISERLTERRSFAWLPATSVAMAALAAIAVVVVEQFAANGANFSLPDIASFTGLAAGLVTAVVAATGIVRLVSRHRDTSLNDEIEELLRKRREDNDPGKRSSYTL
ncbi:hypothetical protein [Agrococcus citreus]|uniref:Holin-X, holin superfamily III n=1 Tax=Agrococcus citreus TaxID=84643 RepID=A0ABP4JFE6_9MICO